MQQFPWTYKEYMKFFGIGPKITKADFMHNDEHWEYIQKTSSMTQLKMNNISGPDSIGLVNQVFKKPKLVDLNGNHKISSSMLSGIEHCICFGNTYHTYGVSENDVTEDVWNFIQHHEIDYGHMTQDNFNLIKIFLLSKKENTQ